MVSWVMPRQMCIRDSKSAAWLWYALGSAVFASLTAILGKVGISGLESNLGTAIRTGVVLLMSWVMVFVDVYKRQSLQCQDHPHDQQASHLWSGSVDGGKNRCCGRRGIRCV